jgi:hypothetical protein
LILREEFFKKHIKFTSADIVKEKINYFFSKDYYVLTFLILLKLFVQFLLLNSGYKWISGDDYSRTVISYQWLEHPKIYAGIWLSLHFWINGFFMLFIHDLFTAATTVNIFFRLRRYFTFLNLPKKFLTEKPLSGARSFFLFSIFRCGSALRDFPNQFISFLLSAEFFITSNSCRQLNLIT